MATRIIAPYLVNPLTKHTATVIFLHGLGDTGAGWLPVAEMMKTELPHVKWVLPNAPVRPITLNFGMSMPGWFDLYTLDMKDNREDRAGMLESVSIVDKLIEDEVKSGIPSERIIVGGFSQGGAMSILVGLTALGMHSGRKLGGVVVLSGFMPLRDEFEKMALPESTNMPMLMCHGTADPVVRYDWGRATYEMLKKKLREADELGSAGLCFRTYDGLAHEASPEELNDVKQFLKRVLP